MGWIPEPFISHRDKDLPGNAARQVWVGSGNELDDKAVSSEDESCSPSFVSIKIILLAIDYI